MSRLDILQSDTQPPVRPRARFRRLASEIDSAWSTDSTDAYPNPAPVRAPRPWGGTHHHHATASKWASMDLFKPRTFQTHPPASAQASIPHEPNPSSARHARSPFGMARATSTSSCDSVATETYGAGPSGAPSSASDVGSDTQSESADSPRARPFRWDTRLARASIQLDAPPFSRAAVTRYSVSPIPPAHPTSSAPPNSSQASSEPPSPMLTRATELAGPSTPPEAPSFNASTALSRLRKRWSSQTMQHPSTLMGEDDGSASTSASASASGAREAIDPVESKVLSAAPTPPSQLAAGHDPFGVLERLGASLAAYKVDTNLFAETTLLVSAALGVAFALYGTAIPALRRPAYALVSQTIIAVGLEPFLRLMDKCFFRFSTRRHESGAGCSRPSLSVNSRVCGSGGTGGSTDRHPSKRTGKGHSPISPPVTARLEVKDERELAYRPAGTSRTDARYVWGLAPARFLRDARDQGLIPGLIMGPLLASACLLDAITAETLQAQGHTPSTVGEWRLPLWPVGANPPVWAVLPPPSPPDGMSCLSSARLALSSMHTLVFIINVTHIVAMRYAPAHWVSPKRTLHRTRNFLLFYGAVTFALASAAPTGILGLLGVSVAGHGSTTASGGLSVWEVILVSALYQTALITTVALARRNFTYGELVVTVAYGVTIMVEAASVTIASITRSVSPHTFRAPNVLLVLQLALIVGTFGMGFLTSPLLYLSRSLAQRPTHRLRWPEKRKGHRKILSASFYTLAAIFIAAVLGPWTRWILHTNPWVWTIRFALGLETLASPPGSLGWRNWSASPLFLLSWWAGCLIATVIFWAAATPNAPSSSSVFVGGGAASPSGAHGSTSLPNSFTLWAWTRGGSPSFTHYGARSRSPFTSPSASFPQLHPDAGGRSTHPDLSAERGKLAETGTPAVTSAEAAAAPSGPIGTGDKAKDDPATPSALSSRSKRPAIWLSLNAKRKFFHVLTIVMFIPGLLLNPAFTHLAMSVAFAVFIMCEYTRYFALYPVGAPLHVFLSRFLDSKDQNGPVILSPFYLLQGCALPLWLEARPSALARTTSTLALGIADAAASVVGRKVGSTRWPQSRKTVEGTLAFIVSLTLAGLFIHTLWPGEGAFSLSSWILTATALGLFEGVSEQNDNLTLPIYSFVLTSLFQL